MKKEFTRIAIKVGSNVLTRQDGTLDVTRMSALTDQIAALHKAGVEVILISSGACGACQGESLRELLPRDEAKYVPSGNSTA